ncbi:MAG: ATP-grasp domain-containing protein [Pseudomonadota bacterium]|nr:ATP-grasp domain-containing protein [Pseudomonadota bacterium]
MGAADVTQAPTLLLIAVSARALAQAARRAGFAPIAIDAFGDEDTRRACRATYVVEGAVAGFAQAELAGVVARALRDHAPAGLVYGSGFDDCPERLATLSRHAPVLGCPPEALARAKDPRGFAAACAAAGIAHPEIGFAAPPEGALLKRRGGSGGTHIQPAERAPGPDEYWQRRIEGRAVSLLFCLDAGALTPIAWSEQWTAPCAQAPFRYGGAAGPLDLTPPDDLLPRLKALARDLGLSGLASADFLDDGERFWLLELNPRPGATLDLFDDAEDPLLARHLGGVDAPVRPRSPRAAEIVYAERDAIAPADWPDWAADLPAAGTPIVAGAPICTVSAAAGDVASAKARARARARRLRVEIEENSR